MSIIISDKSPEQVAYEKIVGAAKQLKINLMDMEAHLAITFVNYDYVRDVYQTLERATNQLSVLVLTPGIDQYARDAEKNKSYDVVAEITSLQTVINAALVGINDQAPATVNLMPPSQWNGGRTMISNVLTDTQTADLRNVLALVISEIG